MAVLLALQVAAGAGPASTGAAPTRAAQPVAAASDARSLRVGVLQPGGRYAVSTLPMETYVARVLAGEAVRDSRPAALEALAIAVRTFALANRGRHRADGFDVCDQTHCQVLRAATPATEAAAQATAGRVLLRNGAPASIYYTASCGGRTEKPSAVWPGADDPPFLPSHDDDACQGAPAWTAELQAADLLRALRAAGFRGQRLTDVRIASRTSSGRVAQLDLIGLPRADLRSGSAGRRRPRARLAAHQEHGVRSPAPGRFYRFSGHGSGHGVGMCVIGSAKLADQGEDRRRYPGPVLSRAFRSATSMAVWSRPRPRRRPIEAAWRDAPAPTSMPP